VVATVLTTYPEEGIVLSDWIGPLANAEAGNANKLSQYPTKSVQVTGTFGAAGSVAIEGSQDGTTWGALRDSTGTLIAITANTMIRDVLENTAFIRPRVTAGDGTTALRVMVVCL